MHDQYNMGGHKLYWHMDRVQQWMQGNRVAPLHIDVGLSKGCNIKCQYCYGVTQGNFFRKGSEIVFPRDALINYVKGAGQAGVKSMSFIGEAEPLLNPGVYEAIIEGTNAGVDIGIGTNGILLDTGKHGEKALEHLTFIRFNISAASDYSYRRVHASKEFETALEKIRFCVETKVKNNLRITIGLQMVLTPENVDQAISLAELGKDMGVDYLVIKQCSDNVTDSLGIYSRLDKYHDFKDVLTQAENVGRGEYKVIVKWDKITNEGKRNYDQCLGAPFLIYTSGDGKVYPCGMFFDHRSKEFFMGDLVTQSFEEIINSQRYWDVVEKVTTIDVHKECYSNCRSHCINDFLWSLKHPPQHLNFI